MNFKAASGAAILGAGICVTAFTGAAHAASSEESRYVHSSCEGADAVCGVIVYAVAGAYTAASVQLKARGDQPDSPVIHSACSNINKKFTRDTPAGNYDTFIVPASCAYKLKISIKSGNSKDKNIYLTPGCQVIAKTDGTVTSNSWKTLEISTLSDAVPTNSSGKPIDPAGYKCGKQSGAGY